MQVVLVTMVLGGHSVLAADSAMTPGTEAQVDVSSQNVSPYVAPANVFVPESSKQIPEQAGKFAHTNYVIHNPGGIQANAISDLGQPEPAANPTPNATMAEYPASLACVYKVGPVYTGCAPKNSPANNATGGSRAIAIVDAYDHANARADLTYFSSYFGLKAPTTTTFKIVKVTTANGYTGANCATIPVNSGWTLESAMDVQWAHAMAPSATIILVEACDNSYAQLMLAEQVAVRQLTGTDIDKGKNYSGGQVSNSWGGGEWSTESTDWDWVFRNNATWVSGRPVSFFFSAGDSGLGAQYPAASPWVVAAGGTTINRDASGNFLSESCWAGSGGGISAYETYGSTFGSGTGPWTNFQYPLFGQYNRSIPDMSFDADPNSGAWVYLNGTWYVVGGTSLSAPALAAIVNSSGQRLGNAPSLGGYWSNLENNYIYSELFTYARYKTDYYDVTTGSNGAAATVGWDYCTGVGSPRGKVGK